MSSPVAVMTAGKNGYAARTTDGISDKEEFITLSLLTVL
jgi:hypothetical protein